MKTERTGINLGTLGLVLHVCAITVGLAGPIVVLGYQAFHWLRSGEWLPLSLSTFGFTAWVGLSELALSLVVFLAALVASWPLRRSY